MGKPGNNVGRVKGGGGCGGKPARAGTGVWVVGQRGVRSRGMRVIGHNRPKPGRTVQPKPMRVTRKPRHGPRGKRVWASVVTSN